jgi:hypothetical protein
MPPATLAAYKDHGNPEVRIDKNLDEARRVMDQLAEAGIHMDEVTKKLEIDGVASFTKSFDSLIVTVEKRRQEALAAGRPAPAKAATKPRRRPPRKKAVRRAAKKAVRRAAKKGSALAKKPRKSAVKTKPRRTKPIGKAPSRRAKTTPRARSSATRRKRRS